MDARQPAAVSSSPSYTANDWTRNLSTRQILPHPHARISQHTTSSMFNKILIANRGEIAVRIIRACRELGIPSVAVFSEADRASLHVRLADEAYPIGAAPSRESYLRIDKLIDVARRSGCDAIIPATVSVPKIPPSPARAKIPILFSSVPPAEAMEALGSKTAGRQLAHRSDVPTVPGANDPIEKSEEAQALARSMGYPVLLKAVSGGGGKGMRLVTSDPEFASRLARCFLRSPERFRRRPPVPREISGKASSHRNPNLRGLPWPRCFPR